MSEFYRAKAISDTLHDRIQNCKEETISWKAAALRHNSLGAFCGNNAVNMI